MDEVEHVTWALRAEPDPRDAVVEAARALKKHADSKIRPGKPIRYVEATQHKTMGDTPGYWSPVAMMVDCEYLAALFEDLAALDRAQEGKE